MNRKRVWQSVTAVLAAGMVSVSLAQPVAETVFQATVTPDLGPPFQDCYRFGADGTLNIDGLGFPLVWSPTRLALRPSGFQSAPIAATADFGIAFTGRINVRLWAEGINDGGGTFTIVGRENPDCASAVATVAPSAVTNPYAPR